METLGVAIWLLALFLLQHNQAGLLTGAGLPVGTHPAQGAESSRGSTTAAAPLISQALAKLSRC